MFTIQVVVFGQWQIWTAKMKLPATSSLLTLSNHIDTLYRVIPLTISYARFLLW